jgi:hypothetical protein
VRTDEQINKIRARIIDPYVVENFLSESDINDLVELYESGANLEEKVNKNTGPTTLDLGNFLDHEVVEKILHRIEQHIGPFVFSG